MAISTVKVQINGTWYNLNYNSTTGKYEAAITAPNITSYNVNSGHYYPVTVQAMNTAGTSTTINDSDASLGNSLKLKVKEKVKPTIAITSPGNEAYVVNSKQPIVFQLRDETNGSGIDLSTLSLQIDSGTLIKNGSSGLVCTAVTGGYNCTYTPPTALSDGSHTVKINVNDYDNNVAAQVIRTYTIDTVPPVLNISNPGNGFITNTAALVVQGTTNDITSTAVTVTIKLNGVDQGTVTVSGGTFSKAITLANGSNTIVITATDAAGKSTTVTITGTLDTSAPVIGSVSITPNPVDTEGSVIISVEVTG